MPAAPAPMRRVSAALTGEVIAPSDLSLAIAVAEGPTIETEILTATVNGVPVDVDEVVDDAGVRRHLMTDLPAGQLAITYTANIVGHAPLAEVRPIDHIEMTWPSRYADSDRLGPTSLAEFTDLSGKDLLDAVVLWVNRHIMYVSGSTDVLDGATEVYLARQGVCRDFAHLVIALLRAQGMPARLVSVYAPGLNPMDFHAVVEACIEDQWYVVDATTMAPRSTMLRIACGRDAADTAFMTVPRGNIRLDTVQIIAVIDGDLPLEDTTSLVQLS